mgnify:FL=1
MLKIKINGKEYPARMVMGALLLFKREAGKDVSELKDDMEDALRLMWCCVKCASQAEGVAFDLDFETFCNSITPQDVAEWNASMAAQDKKKAPQMATQTERQT